MPPQLQNISQEAINSLESLVNHISGIDIKAVKDLEAVTNHDVKAVEYYIKQNYENQLGHGSEFVHFGLTSQDINNTAIPAALKDAMEKVMIPTFNSVRSRLAELAEEWRNIPMLAHTHGQPASPTTLGKENSSLLDHWMFSLNLSKQFHGRQNLVAQQVTLMHTMLPILRLTG